MKKTNTLLLSLILLGGCSQSAKIDNFNNNIAYERSIIYTQKIILTHEGKTQAQLMLTHLNALEQKNYENQDAFIVSFYSTEEQDNLEKNGAYSLFSGQKTQATTFQKLSKKDRLMKYVPSYNAWSDYYLVIFPSIKSKESVKLTFTSKAYGEKHVTFSKNGLNRPLLLL